MERFEERRRADAPIEDCWAVLVAAERAPEWVPFVSTATDDGRNGVGRVQTVTGSLLGISMDVEQVVDVWEPPHRFGWVADRPFTTRLRVELEPVDAATTQITAAIEADLGTFPVGRRIAAMTVRRQFARSADALVELVEQRASEAGSGPATPGDPA
ncbi:SRPBCC family protein [Egicoccus sp. AB-alg6-2]|uniref:SRPBCC family protein n=1 Tax=Egicoccus sp. AB-alg6-2 TaxID=3242692 RepID=UPI00359E70B3